MNIRTSALLTAAVFGVLMLLGTYRAHACDGCANGEQSTRIAAQGSAAGMIDERG